MMAASGVSLAAGLFQTTRPGTSAWQSAATVSSYSLVRRRPKPLRSRSTSTHFPAPSGSLWTQRPPSSRRPSYSLMTSALRVRTGLLTLPSPLNLRQRSFRFYPPHCYQASLAGTSSLLRLHLPPHTRHALGFHLDACPPAELDTVPGFPGYCTGSQLTMPPSITTQVWLSIGLRAILHA